MRIVYHLGVHCTDEDRLIRTLVRNREVLGRLGIVVPQPARYRTLLRDTLIALRGQPASEETQALTLDQIMEEDRAERLILSNDDFLAYPQWVLRGALYPTAGERLRAVTLLWPDIPAEFHLAIRNPATFLPALFARQRGKSYDEFMSGCRPEGLRWSDMIARIRDQNPGVPLTVWCDEDTPLLWPEILRCVAGHPAALRLEGELDHIATLLAPEGYERMRAYLADHEPLTDDQRRRVFSAFLDKFARPDQIEMELDLPGWTEDLLADLTEAYDADVARIGAMPGVRLLLP